MGLRRLGCKKNTKNVESEMSCLSALIGCNHRQN
jgi:hypothetical protein